MEWVKPHKIERGMTLGFLAPASSSEEDLQRIEAIAQERGYKAIFGRTCYGTGLYGGTPEEQAREFNLFMTNEACQAVIALRGGYGCARYVDLLDYAAIRKHCKPFVGYSDCTALHLALHRHSRLVTYHGPMGVDWVKPGREADLDHLFDLLEGRMSVVEPLPAPPRGYIGAQMAEGRLLGGNLAILCSLGGTDYMPTKEMWQEAILFIEDIGEPPYKIDRMLQQLRLQGILKTVKGAVIGSFTACEGDEGDPVYDIGAKVLEYMEQDRPDTADEPFVCYAPTGHGTPHWALPLGQYVSFRAISNTLLLVP